jgi:protein SCO1/2
MQLWTKGLKKRVQTLLACSSLLLLTVLVACTPKPLNFNGVDITGSDSGRTLEWLDASGRTKQLKDLKGRVALVFFGYSQCPDVCPTSLTELREIKESLGPEGQKVQVIFITVDPERDTPEVLQAYVSNFGQDIISISPSPEQLKAWAKEFNIYYDRVNGPTPTSYTMEHTAGYYIYDTQARLRLFSRYGTPKDALQADIQTLLKDAKS